MSLEDKLKEILQFPDAVEGPPEWYLEKAVAQIKQAFTDEGYNAEVESQEIMKEQI